ncbi:MAG: glutamate racemase [Gammaproteobacteria bacterium]|nr:glutamate racemase [Gammaproteobacteria bacterium]
MSIQPFRILIFDSGVGGLSVYQSIKAELDKHIHNRGDVNNQYIYFADHQAAPYGDKSDDWLSNRIQSLMVMLNQQEKPDVIVLACNTASTLALDRLRASLDLPIIGVVPAIKTAAIMARKCENNKIGLLATPATVKRHYIDDLKQQHAGDVALIRVGTTKLVNMAEQKLSGIAPELPVIKAIIEPFVLAQCQHVVLGCTHFPLLKQELNDAAPDIEWIDSGQAIAERTRHIKSLLSTDQIAQSPVPSYQHKFISSASMSKELKAYVQSLGFDQVKTL